MANDFRLFLQGELVRRCRRNPRYSLRAFAGHLRVSPSFLSHLLRGRRNVTPANLERISEALGLAPARIQDFRRGLAASRETPVSRFTQLARDQYEVVSDWSHYAILELLTVDGFRPSAHAIARALSISRPEANAAIERLQRLGILAIDPSGRWINRSGSHTTVGTACPASALRNLQRRILEGAMRALAETPIEERDQSSLTLALDSRLLPEVRARLKRLRAELGALQKSSGRTNQVYQMSFSIYPLLKKTKGPRT
jgi:uncharacterized protein (TIGR02147 family)